MSAKTLLDIFVPPDGLVGHSAALVAMTGAADFLEEAMLRFTGLQSRQRAELGKVLVYLMLDGHASSSRQEVFPPGRIPGLHECQPRADKPGSLLHAKVALLAFAPNRTGAPVCLRLAILTANYTYTSALQQLELVWVVDVTLDDTSPPEDRADVAVAGAFIRELLERRFYRDDELNARLDILLEKTQTSSSRALPPSRFIHSLDRTLYDQILERFSQPPSGRTHKRFRGLKTIRKPETLLLCGSGFYEKPSRKKCKPTVFSKLEKLASITKKSYRVALVEPDMAGAVATWAKSGDTDAWTIVRPFDPLGRKRRLHAKFIYVGDFRDGNASNGWLYLGSGNLSYRGILSHGGMDDGNVETGVVFSLDEQLDRQTIEQWLFWSDGADPIGNEEWAIGQVGDAPDQTTILEAPPILSAKIETATSRCLRLQWRDDLPDGARVKISWTGHDRVYTQQKTKISLRNDEAPTALNVCSGNGRSWVVPVVDAEGRIGWQPPLFDTFADALSALLDFPISPSEANDEGDGYEVKGDATKSLAAEAAIEQEKNYAMHAAAELVEKVATLQSELPESMLDDWLDHLDRILSSSFPESLITAWRNHSLDVFAHLREPELRPTHFTVEQLEKYIKLLDRTALAWRLR